VGVESEVPVIVVVVVVVDDDWVSSVTVAEHTSSNMQDLPKEKNQRPQQLSAVACKYELANES
jgi:hypothetical protein